MKRLITLETSSKIITSCLVGSLTNLYYYAMMKLAPSHTSDLDVTHVIH